jgi:putative transposase
VCAERGVIAFQSALFVQTRPPQINVTMPPRVLITDKLGSYRLAKRELLPDVEHRKSRYLNNRAENSHRPTRRRRRERQMQMFKSTPQAQRFLSAHTFIYGHF